MMKIVNALTVSKLSTSLNDIPIGQVFSGVMRHPSGVTHEGVFWKIAHPAGSSPWAIALDTKKSGQIADGWPRAGENGCTVWISCVEVENYVPLEATLTIHGK